MNEKDEFSKMISKQAKKTLKERLEAERNYHGDMTMKYQRAINAISRGCSSTNVAAALNEVVHLRS